MSTLLDIATQEEIPCFASEPSFRRSQVLDALFRQSLFPHEMSAVPAHMRQEMEDAFPPALTEVAVSTSDGGDTTKWLYEVRGGARIETVLMHYPRRTTVCISTQAGCAMGCSFCATGQGGFTRQLSTPEILEQVFRARRAAKPRNVTHIVFMGMGEPLANYPRTSTAIGTLTHQMGFSARRLTVSTVGVIPGIERLAREGIPVTLAVSLHGATDELRSELIPLNRRYPLARLLSACEYYFEKTRRRISLEWALIDSVNDTDDQIARLAGIATRLRAHVNLIPLNPTPGYPVIGSSPERVADVAHLLTDLGVNCTVRDTRGRTIDAACGQLAARNAPVALEAPRLSR